MISETYLIEKFDCFMKWPELILSEYTPPHGKSTFLLNNADYFSFSSRKSTLLDRAQLGLVNKIKLGSDPVYFKILLKIFQILMHKI